MPQKHTPSETETAEVTAYKPSKLPPPPQWEAWQAQDAAVARVAAVGRAGVSAKEFADALSGATATHVPPEVLASLGVSSTPPPRGVVNRNLRRRRRYTAYPLWLGKCDMNRAVIATFRANGEKIHFKGTPTLFARFARARDAARKARSVPGARRKWFMRVVFGFKPFASFWGVPTHFENARTEYTDRYIVNRQIMAKRADEKRKAAARKAHAQSGMQRVNGNGPVSNPCGPPPSGKYGQSAVRRPAQEAKIKDLEREVRDVRTDLETARLSYMDERQHFRDEADTWRAKVDALQSELYDKKNHVEALNAEVMRLRILLHSSAALPVRPTLETKETHHAA